jgi:Raf kinase inhibitor-like YbhB/YbcL family protein
VLKYSILVFAISFAACNSVNNNISGTQNNTPPTPKEWKLTSPAFKDGDTIPPLYTCDSTNISPMLHWATPSGNVKSYALIMDDPDAPMGVWTHWVIYNIPPTDTLLAQHLSTDSILSNNARQGITSFPTYGYGGPCPPNGMHRYYFKLFALDTIFNNLPCKSTGAKTLTAAMKGHILAEAQLMGKYVKKLKGKS